MLSGPTPRNEFAELAAVADRYDQSGAKAKAARFYRLASEKALAAYANDEALIFIDQALTLTPDANANSRFTLLRAREGLYALMGHSNGQKKDLASLAVLADSLNDDEKRAAVAVRQAAFRESKGDYVGAVAMAQLATRLAQLTNQPHSEAGGRLIWGKALLRQGDYSAARTQLNAALRLAPNLMDANLKADILRHLGILANDQGNYAEATHHYDQSLALYRDLGDRLGEGHVLNNLGHIDQAQGKLSAAKSHWEAARAVYSDLGDQEGIVRILINLSTVSLDLGYYDRAKVYNEEALEISKEIDSKLGECFALLNLGLVAHYQKQGTQAQSALREGLAVAEMLGSKRLQGHALSVLGHVYVDLGQLHEANDAYWEAISIWEELELPNLAAETSAGLARAALLSGDMNVALSSVEEILDQIEVDPNLDGAELPARIYLTCYRVLLTLQDERSERVKSLGRVYLSRLIDAIKDEEAQTNLKQNVAAVRDLLALFNA